MQAPYSIHRLVEQTLDIFFTWTILCVQYGYIKQKLKQTSGKMLVFWRLWRPFTTSKLKSVVFTTFWKPLESGVFQCLSASAAHEQL